MKLVLDTNIYSDYAEGVPEIIEFMATHARFIFLPAVVLGELGYGFLKGRRRLLNEKKLGEFIDLLKVDIIPVDEAVARKYGRIFLSLRQKGRKIPINDVWIAACCMEVGGTLLTRDRHFEMVEQIETVIFG